MSHYDLGYNDYNHRGVRVRSIVGNQEADTFVQNLEALNLGEGYIPPGYEHRPDLVANLFYGSAKYFWYVALTSQLYDIFEDFIVGQRIKIPNE